VASLPAIQSAYEASPTVSRALARGVLGDRTALQDLMGMVERHLNPSSYPIMDDTLRASVLTLHTVGLVSAEQALELLTHHAFDLDSAATRKEKKRTVKSARRWLRENLPDLLLDRRRGYFKAPTP
jgi:hypothetical protein